MIPIDKVIKILERHDSLEKELSTGKVDPKSLAKKSKEYSDLKKMVSQAKFTLPTNTSNSMSKIQLFHDVQQPFKGGS